MTSGTSCGQYVLRVLGLSNLRGANKGEYYPDDVFTIVFSKYIYDKYYQIDPAHGTPHIQCVRREARHIAKDIRYDNLFLVDMVALLHDIARGTHGETHEDEGAKIVASDKVIKPIFSNTELKEVVAAIKEHRASTGKPRTTLAKILSDGDRLGSSGYLIRSYVYHLHKFPHLSKDIALVKAAEHNKHKYGPGGYGNKTYFPATQKRINNKVMPIVNAYDNNDIKTLKRILREEAILFKQDMQIQYIFTN
jgi:hypothetical protein